MVRALAEPSRRKQLGAWYTPPELVAHVAGETIGRRRGGGRGPVRVLDPACGDGRFLAEARRRLGDRAVLTGIDIDPEAVAAARAALPGAEIVQADALAHDWGDRCFDVVLGNPPFLNQMARATTRGGRSRFGGGAYADVAAEFLALSTTLLADGGRLGLVLPQSILASRDVGPIRRLVTDRGVVRHLWWSDTRMFDAHVHVCALVVQAGARPGRVSRATGRGFDTRPAVPFGVVGTSGVWSALLLDGDEVGSAAGAPGGATLGDIAAVSVDFRDQYYGLVGAVGDHVDGPPLVTSGSIDPGVCRWGERPVRFAKQRYEAPRVALDRLSPRMRAWADERLVPKVLVANQTKRIEAVIDRDGAWLPGVPVLTCTGDDLDRIHAVLSSDAATAWVRARALGTGLSAGTVRLSPALLAGVPLGE
jgi:SAM-dependent methyltransferase